MTITKKLTSMATAAALAATALVPMATTASAKDWNDGRKGGNYSRNWDGDRGDRYDGRRHRYGHRRHKDNTGKYIAIGLGALMLGIIASEAGRH
jgi:Spy/CpxP family protein refolding chaperone